MLDNVSDPVGSAPSAEAALDALRHRIAAARFSLDTSGAARARATQQQILEQIDDHLLPRLRRMDAPLLVVVGGSTGAGKSTLVNSLAQERVAVTGVRRPTTRSPVLVCNPEDRPYFVGEHADVGAPEEPDSVPVGVSELPRGVALLDTPDVDSVVDSNREIATRLIAVADLWLYVTTAARYADAVPWELLRSAQERGATLAVTLNRAPRAGGGEVREHLAELLAERGFGEPRLFSVPETMVEEGLLPAGAVKNLRAWLAELAGPQRATLLESAVRRQIDGLRRRVPELATQLEHQLATAAELRDEAQASFAAAVAEVDERTRDGSLLRGQALRSWQGYAGSGELLRSMQARRGGLRAKLRPLPDAQLPAGDELRDALVDALASEIRSDAHAAAARTVQRWSEDPAGARLLAGAEEDLGTGSTTLPERAREAASQWQEKVLQMVREEGATKRSVSRIVSVDPDGLALVLMVGLFGYAASESSAVDDGMVPRKLLAEIFGAESFRTIADKARADLRSRAGTVLDEEARRFVRLLEATRIPDDSAVTQLYQATHSLEVAQ